MTVKSIPRMHLLARCKTCKTYHEENIPIAAMVARLGDWHVKHEGHEIDFLSRKRIVPADLDDSFFVERNVTPWWLEYRENANFLLAYATSASYTITLTGLASSSNLLAGRQSTPISNTTNFYLDYLVAGNIIVNGVSAVTTGTTIEVWAFASQNDTPTYPDTFSTADANRTITSAGIKTSAIAPIANLNVDVTTLALSYPFYPVSLAILFGRVPKNHGVWVVQNTVQALHASAAGGIQYTGVFMTG